MPLSTPRVLAIDDDPGVLKLIELEFDEHELDLLTARGGEEGLELARIGHPDLVVLDVALPDLSGFEVMRRLRERQSMPVIMLTARGDDRDKVRGLELGADDYVAKPFNPAELAARVQAVLRRSRAVEAPAPVLQHGDVTIDLGRRLVAYKGETVALTRTEWHLLEELARNPGKVLPNMDILARVWGPEYRDDLQYLRVWVSRLRAKLDPERAEPELVQTFSGVGYMLRAEPVPSAEDADADVPDAAPELDGREAPTPAFALDPSRVPL